MNPFLYILQRLTEPSSAAGIGLAVNGVHGLSTGGDITTGLTNLFAGIGAILWPESANKNTGSQG